MKFFMLALMGLAVLDAHAAENGSATAAAVSAFTFSGIKGSLTAAPNVPAADKACIAAIPDTSLADVFLPLIRRDLAGELLTRFDAFFTSALGRRYVAAFVASPSTAGFTPAAFNEDETETIGATMNHPEFSAFATRINASMPGPVQDKAMNLILACRGSPAAQPKDA